MLPWTVRAVRIRWYLQDSPKSKNNTALFYSFVNLFGCMHRIRHKDFVEKTGLRSLALFPLYRYICDISSFSTPLNVQVRTCLLLTWYIVSVYLCMLHPLSAHALSSLFQSMFAYNTHSSFPLNSLIAPLLYILEVVFLSRLHIKKMYVR